MAAAHRHWVCLRLLLHIAADRRAPFRAALATLQDASASCLAAAVKTLNPKTLNL
jgi:hypothetical protein